MPGALRPSDDLSKKSNVTPSINRRTEATAEDFKELSDITTNHANLLDELTQAENRNLFYGIFESKELLEAAFDNVEEDGIAIVDPQVGQQIIAKYKNGVWTYQEVTAPIQFYPTKLDRPANGETGIWYIVLDEKKAYLWYGGGWLGIGTDGQNGISAYQIAVAYGFVGTEEEWLDSIKEGLTFVWDGTRLGVKKTTDGDFVYSPDLKGPPGPPGPPGTASNFNIDGGRADSIYTATQKLDGGNSI